MKKVFLLTLLLLFICNLAFAEKAEWIHLKENVYYDKLYTKSYSVDHEDFVKTRVKHDNEEKGYVIVYYIINKDQKLMKMVKTENYDAKGNLIKTYIINSGWDELFKIHEMILKEVD